MVYRIFVEKKPGLDNEARELLGEARNLLGITGLEKVRLLNRYDAENMDPELFRRAVKTVFSEPQREALCPVRKADGGRDRGDQKVRDQPGGSAGGFS